jgi:hypothetical protein
MTYDDVIFWYFVGLYEFGLLCIVLPLAKKAVRS